jgi:hypothetical protein
MENIDPRHDAGMAEIQRVAGTIFARMEATRAPAAVDRTFKSLFGCSIYIAFMLWEYLLMYHNKPPFDGFVPIEGSVVNMLWALCFLKLYPTESQMAAWFGADRNTIRKYVWLYINYLADMSDWKVSEYLFLQCFFFLLPYY